MTRGRKKDLTIPPSRALTQQRDYRARKAQYLTELEDRCRSLEAENASLRRELLALQGMSFTSSAVDSQLVSASSELMRDLSTASSSLEHFYKLASSHTMQSGASPSSSPSVSSASISLQEVSRLRPAFFSSPSLSDVSLPTQDLDHDRSTSPELKVPARPPESQSLRKILCLPSISETSQSEPATVNQTSMPVNQENIRYS